MNSLKYKNFDIDRINIFLSQEDSCKKDLIPIKYQSNRKVQGIKMESVDFSKMDMKHVARLAKFLNFGYYSVTESGEFIECDQKTREIFGIDLNETDLSKYSTVECQLLSKKIFKFKSYRNYINLIVQYKTIIV